MKIDKWYKEILRELNQQEFELNERTGIKTKSLPGITFRTDLEKDGFPLLALRKISKAFIAEQLWFISGSNDTKQLQTRIWDYFAEDDGTVSSAYGYRWRKHFNVDQLQIVIDKLQNNKSDRHGVIMMWSPEEDLTIKQKNVPCPFTFTLNIIDNRLHLHLVVRSNDMILGFPTDVAGFALLQMIIAQELGVKPGIYTHSISNCHYYENQQESVDIMLKRPVSDEKVRAVLPSKTFKRAEALDTMLKNEIKIENYQPLESIKKIPIAI